MNAQILAVAEAFEGGIRNGTDTHLQGRAVLHQVGNVPSNLEIFVCQLCSVVYLRQHVFTQHHGIESAHVNESIPMCAGHVGVNLGDDVFGIFCC